jgi:hypothetical protein
MTSSLYEPNLERRTLFEDLAHYCQVVSVEEVETVRLDDVPEARLPDYLKLDVQGAELDVLKAATETLKSVRVIQTEVEFVEIYRGQPLFAEVDRFLRSHGFMFHRLINTEGRSLQPVTGAFENKAGSGQTLWSDAVYVRDIRTWDALPDDGLLKMAALLHEIYGSYDFAAKLLHIHSRRTGSVFYDRYTEALR